MTFVAIVFLAALFAAAAPAGAQTAVEAATAPPEPAVEESAPIRLLFTNPDGHPVVHLDAAAVDSVGTALSERNLQRLERVDDEYRKGTYGKPGSSRAKEDAFSAFVFGAETGFDFFLALALQDQVIYSLSENDLKAAFTERFRNPGLYPIVNLLDARAGFGVFGMQFEVDDPTPREIVVSGEKMRAWTEEIAWAGETFRVVNIDMKTVSHDRVHVVYRRYACGEVQRFTVDQGGTPVDVVVLEELAGQYVQKWGFHRPRALTLWKTKTDGLTAPPEADRYLGTAIYFPHLKLKLPSLLPDVGFNDLRRFDFPEPILTMAAVEEVRTRKLDWIRIRKDLRFANWEGQGVVPDAVKERYPDQ